MANLKVHMETRSTDNQFERQTASNTPVQQVHSAAGRESLPLDGRWILVVDDVESNRKVCSVLLERAGATVTGASDGKEAVEICSRRRFDLVLMDIQMPGLNGLDASRAIRATGYSAPILALTAMAYSGVRRDCIAAGMNEFLTKPISPAIMIQTITRWARTQEPMRHATHTASALPSWELDPEIEEFAREWLVELTARLEKIDHALLAGDMETAARGAHSIKGSGGSLGMPEFTRPADALESAAKAGIIDGAQAAVRTLRQLQAAAVQRSRNKAA